MTNFKEKLKCMHELEKLRSQFVIVGTCMELAYGKDFRHASEMYGAADITQEWIEEIREEISQ
jgi:glycogen synthase